MKKKIYIVMGSTGAYSDRTDWAVVAYESKELAEQHVINAQTEAKKIQTMKEGLDDRHSYDSDPRSINKWDKGMMMDYTGTHYYWNEVVLLDGVKTMKDFDIHWFAEFV